MSIQCVKCGYSVTEPICCSCVISEIKDWLSGQRTNKHIIKKINMELRSLSNRVESTDYVILPSPNKWKSPVMRCIRCRKEMHLMCFYCVTNEASRIVKKNLKNESSIENFSESFNTQLYDYELNKNLFIN